MVIQSYTPEHYSIIHASDHDYLSFVKDELKHRKALHYPPYCRLILVTLSHGGTRAGKNGGEFCATIKVNPTAGDGLEAWTDSTQARLIYWVGSLPIPRLKIDTDFNV